MNIDEHRRLTAEWVNAYHEARLLMPLAINLDAPDADKRLRESAYADWGAINAAWDRVAQAKKALDEYRRRRAEE